MRVSDLKKYLDNLGAGAEDAVVLIRGEFGCLTEPVPPGESSGNTYGILKGVKSFDLIEVFDQYDEERKEPRRALWIDFTDPHDWVTEDDL